MNHTLLQEAKNIESELIVWRHSLHQIPELGTKLPKTTEFIKEKLTSLGIPYTEYEDCSCITAILGKGGSCFLLRSDMDGLPMPEESCEPFASKNGCMHACGHDLHATILLGAAKLLKEHEPELNGTVKLLFQSGEETFEGAKIMVEKGVLENPHVNAAFAMHVASILPAGSIIYGPYPMAAVYGFRITLTGKGTHGSTPQLGIDPINTGVHIYLALQELIAREVSPNEEAVLTIGRFDAGKVSNVIPERAILEGTLRTFKPKIREMLVNRIRETVESVAKTYRTDVSFEVLSDVPPVACDEALNLEMLDSIRELDSSIHLLPLYHVMGSEDFAFISEKVPSTYLGLGAAVDDRSQWLGQHNPKVRFTDECLVTGAAIYAKAAMDWLENHNP